MQNTCLSCTVSQVLKVFLIRSYIIQPVLLFPVILLWLLYTSADMTFYKVLGLHSPLSGKKKFFVTNSPFLIDSPKSLHPLNSQNSLSVTILYLEARM